ncbi:MAG: acyl-protein synthetase [Gemmatimonadota bacterium]|nr:acyl-protein synthetase [Gemmatimonadota bacterium]
MNDDNHAGAFETMVEALRARLTEGNWESWSPEEFDRRARAAFEVQFEACSPYRALCERRGVTPTSVARWEDIPAVPAAAFKHFLFDSSGSDSSVDASTRALFRTSGTTEGRQSRGRHVVPRLDLYRASLVEPFRRGLLPDRASIVFLSLVPSPDEVPDSSLSFMVGAAAERLASEVVWLMGKDGGWVEHASDRVAEIRASGEPVLLLGTALSFLHLVEDGGNALSRLPEGSRIMETGGFKGVRRTVSREELYRDIEGSTGVPRARIVNEYGMTELLSQLYEPVLTEGAEAFGVHRPPPWLAVRALDPTTLAPLPDGQEGVLAFFDLANLGSVCHVLTEDVGAIEQGRVRLRGRATGAEPRGCSRAMDELMSAAGQRR